MIRLSKNIRRKSLIIACITYAVTSGMSAEINSDSDVIDAINRELNTARDKLESVQLNISDQRRKLRAESKSIRHQRDSLNRDAVTLESETISLEEKIHKLQIDKRKHNHQLKQIGDTIQFNLKEFRELYSMAFPKDNQVLNLITNFDKNSKDLNKLFDTTNSFYWDFIQKACSLGYGSYELYSESGEKFTADALFVGLMGGSYWTKKESGIIYFHPESPQVRTQKSGMNRSQRQLLASVNSDNTDYLPVHLDVSNGMALQQLRVKRDWKEFFQAGGTVMIPLAVIGIIAVLMMIERVIYFVLFRLSFKNLYKKIITLINERDFDSAHEIAMSHWGPGKKFWLKGLEIFKKSSGDIDAALQHLIMAQLPKLERSLSTLAVFAAICPLLGLLGTVSGMIKTFQIITLYGTSNSGMLSQGISEALITTQVGLVLAIPILLIHAMLLRQSRAIVIHMDLTARQFTESN